MADERRVQLRDVMGILVPLIVMLLTPVVLFVLPGLLLGCAAFGFSEPSGHNIADARIGVSALIAVVFWCLGWPLAIADYSDRLFPRLFWTLGGVASLVHIAIAFHLGHGWSHSAAWEHTRQVGGYGDGIFVNYAFALVWLADGVWVWASPRSYFARPRWLNGAIHGFLAFVVLNAAVVFGGWQSRVVFVVSFSGVAWLLWTGSKDEGRGAMNEVM